MKETLDITIVEIIEREPVSVRLRNALLRAASEDILPFRKLSEYLINKDENVQRLLKIPNLGKKSANELIALLDKHIEDSFGPEPRSNTVRQQTYSINIPATHMSMRTVSFIQTSQCSVRLQNALVGAIERNEFNAERLGDLHGKSIHSLKQELRKVANLGQKSAKEFLDLLNTLATSITGELSHGISTQSHQATENKDRDYKSEFISLLRREGFSSITVIDILNRTPGLSRQERALPGKINTTYQTMPLCEILTKIGGDFYEISAGILSDTKLSSKLAIILTDFYRFLLIRKEISFCHDKYFSSDLSNLEDREVEVLLARFGPKRQTLEELGRRFNVSRERIRQIESKALDRYIKKNRVGLFHLSESLDKYINASKGVLSIQIAQRLYGIAVQKLELILYFIIPAGKDGRLKRDGDHILSKDFRSRQDQVFRRIEEFIYRHIGCNSKTLIEEIEGVNRPILEYFIYRNKGKFSTIPGGDIVIVSNSASERAKIVLRAAGQPLHTSEAARLYKTIFREDVTEHALGSTLNRLPEVLIIGPGKFALYDHLKLDADDIDRIKKDSYRLIRTEGRYLSSKVIFQHLCSAQPGLIKKEPLFNYYMVHGILQDDGRYRIRRGFMVGLPTYGDYLPLEAEIAEMVEVHGPVSIAEIIELLRPTRGELTNGSVRNSLVASEDIYLSAQNRKWDIVDRVFREPADIRQLQTAVRMAAYKEPTALSTLYNRVRSTGIQYALGTILSLVWKDPDIMLEGDYVCFIGVDTEIESYYATGEPKALWQLDFRNHTEEKSVDTDLLDALVKEFDLYV